MFRKPFVCDATGDLCNSPKCKIGFCIVENQERESEKERARLEALGRARLEALELEAAVRKAAAAALKSKGIKKPTAELVQRTARQFMQRIREMKTAGHASE
jgi:hypothetical protein